MKKRDRSIISIIGILFAGAAKSFIIQSRLVILFTILILLISSCANNRREEKEERNIDATYKHWLIYNLDVKTFQDSDNDGEGDFKGLMSRLDYLQYLGVNTIWLAPFQPSPQQDDGYDISDYYSIDPKLGTKQDLRNFLSKARMRGLHVIMDIVLNHTSIQHRWFRSKRDWYLWSVKRPADWDKGMGFPGVEKDTWHYDSIAHQYYFHRFYNFQPDLNYQNPQVVAEAKKIMAFWLDEGLDGFRLDAVPFIIDDPRKNSEKPAYQFTILHELAGFVRQHKPGAVLLGEANVEPDENERYFKGRHEGLDMMFNFYANQYLFYGLATGNAAGFKDALKKTKAKAGAAQWAWFLRNHDEIDLGRLSRHKLNQAYQKMGPDTTMQLYHRGIRRRLATMLGNNQKQLRLAYSLLYALPGTPVIRQGEEIGMGDDLSLKERLAVRTPMQWDTTLNGGFTKGYPFRPVISSVEYGYRAVNVLKEQQDASSLLRFIRQIIALRKQYPEINNGEWEVLNTPKEILAIRYTEHGKQSMTVHNFSDQPQDFKYGNKSFVLEGYAFKWLRL